MNLNELLPAGAIDALAAQLGIPPEQAEQGAKALLPSILGAIGDCAGGPQADNATVLQAQLNQLGGGELADHVLGPEPTDIARGNQLLGGIFGSKDVSREVANTASQSGGLDPALLRRMLPILAMLVAGYMTK